MELFEAKILFKNLLKRVRTFEDGSKHLEFLTEEELEALQAALSQLEGHPLPPATPAAMTVDTGKYIPPIPEYQSKSQIGHERAEPEPVSPATGSDDSAQLIDLDQSVLSLPNPPADVRLCLDFGTAMSKATLIHDHADNGSEEIVVLELGIPGDQEEISEVMLISSVYIDNEGLLWFGKMAVDHSMSENAGDGSRQRLDNIKRRLSEEGLGEPVDQQYNPTDIPITYGDMVLAYLMFLTWAVNHTLEDREEPYPRNLPRRFAMPCLQGEKSREAKHQLRQLLGEAQILADTFFSTLQNGIPLQRFVDAVRELRKEPHEYQFIAESITEPLGVSGSLMSWHSKQDMMVLVVDIGAGTSDFGLFRINIDLENDINASMEIEGSAAGITEAGNYLDRVLVELILAKAGISSEDPHCVSVRGALELSIRDYKETLFNEEFVFIPLNKNGETIEVEMELEEFLAHEAVKKFGDSLRNEMRNILESVDSSAVNWIAANPTRKLVVVLTGGGAGLPMVKELATGSMVINGVNLPLVQALPFPSWLQEEYQELEDDYPRIAVSLGGARKRLISSKGKARVIGGDVTQPPKLGGYYMKGN